MEQEKPNHEEELSPETVRAIALAVAAYLDERRSVDEATHQQHHQYVAERIQERKAAIEMRQAITRHVLGWGIVGLISGIGAAAYQIVDNWVHKGAG